MRNPKRIPICLKLLYANKVLSNFLGDYPENKHIKCGYAKIIHENWYLIENVWIMHPDLRFGQLLSNLRLIKDACIEDHIWNIEEDNWLIDNNYIKIEDIKFWGVNFHKNGNKRKKIKFVLLKDLKTDHIVNIIKFFEGRLNAIPVEYLRYFNKRIELNN